VFSKDAKFLKNFAIEALLVDQPAESRLKSVAFNPESESEMIITRENEEQFLLKLDLSNLDSVKIVYYKLKPKEVDLIKPNFGLFIKELESPYKNIRNYGKIKEN